MKKIIIAATALTLASSCAYMTSFAEDNDLCKAYVTVSLGEDGLGAVQREVDVTDIDGDGKLTVNDALYNFHEQNFKGGAAAGYKSSTGQYGLSLDKLCGIENGGSYGYYVNNKSSMSLADEISSGDYIYAFVYKDTTAWSDTYSWFDKNTVSGECGEAFELTLNHYAYDANWNPVAEPVAGATILIGGAPTEFVTDADGKVTVTLEKAGRNEISAKSEALNLVPPVLVANMTGGDSTTTTTTTTAVVTSTSTSTDTATSTSTTSAASSTSTQAASNGGNAPQTGVAGVGTAAAALAVSVFAAFAVRKRNED